MAGDRRTEIHMRQHVPLKIDTWGNFNELDTAWAAPEYGSFGDIQSLLPTLLGEFSIVRYLLQLVHKFIEAAFFQNFCFPIWPAHFQAASCKSSAEDHLLGVLADIDKATHPNDAPI